MDEAETEEQYFCNEEEDLDHDDYEFEDLSFAERDED